MRARRLLLAVLGLALVVSTSPVQAGGAGGTTYKAPFTQGPSGPDPKVDQWNYLSADPATGTITVVRYNPTPGAFNCAGNGGYDYLRVTHTVTDPVSTVTASYGQAALDGYTWVKANVSYVDSAGVTQWLGAAEQRGPLAADGSAVPGTITVPLDFSPPAGTAVTIDVGLQVASACPNVDGGTVQLQQVTVG
jgi:hypothetical protein